MKTKFKYEVRPSKHSKNYFYIVEVQTDEFGTTADAITKPLSIEEINSIANDICRLNDSPQYIECPKCGHAV